MNKRRARCKTCLYWHGDALSSLPGECRLRGPWALPSTRQERDVEGGVSVVPTRFPLMFAMEWCGEYAPLPRSRHHEDAGRDCGRGGRVHHQS